MRVRLTGDERAMLDGEHGEGVALAMRVVARMADVMEADELVPIAAAHVDGCLYHGRAQLDFCERLVEGEAVVAVPSTLNVGSLDLLHPQLYRGDLETGELGRRLMDLHVALGCTPTWTCAPYQLPQRPGFGTHVAWGESNAIVFANSVLGARTERYGDFLDIACAIVGRAPLAGLHLEENRRARLVVRLHDVPDRLLHEEILFPVLGHLVGREAGSLVPAIVGLPADAVDEDRMKALGAAAASSGSVALVHVVGVTPEAPTIAAALRGAEPDREVVVGSDELRAARDELSSTAREDLAAVSLGTPHFSLAEFERLVPLLEGRLAAPGVEVYVSTGRDVLADVEARGWLEELERFGASVVTDTCTYVTPIIRNTDGAVMTSSAKWAWYAPGNLGLDVVFGSLEECVDSAVRGRVVREEGLWA